MTDPDQLRQVRDALQVIVELLDDDPDCHFHDCRQCAAVKSGRAALSTLDALLSGQAPAAQAVFDAAMNASWQCVDRFAAPGTPGSYARGSHNGMIDALNTVRANWNVAIRAAPPPPPAQPEPKGVNDRQGHGHVMPRPDGVKARCGGPALCRICQSEQAALVAQPEPSPATAQAALVELIEAIDAQQDLQLSHPAIRRMINADHAVSVGVRLDAAWQAARQIAQGAQPAAAPAMQPLTAEQINTLISTKHFDPSYQLHDSDRVCLGWYRVGIRDAEQHHGIGILPAAAPTPTPTEPA